MAKAIDKSAIERELLIMEQMAKTLSKQSCKVRQMLGLGEAPAPERVKKVKGLESATAADVLGKFRTRHAKKKVF